MKGNRLITEALPGIDSDIVSLRNFLLHAGGIQTIFLEEEI
jgi:hypothetical protein